MTYDEWKLKAPESHENGPQRGVCSECVKFISQCPCGCGWGFCAADGERVFRDDLCEIEEFEEG